jgi:hypothetical protein
MSIVTRLLSTEWWDNVSAEDMLARLERNYRFALGNLSLREQHQVLTDMATVRQYVTHNG